MTGQPRESGQPRELGLPIEPVLPQLAEALRAHNAAALVAPPGAGKTTRVPLALLEEPWLGGPNGLGGVGGGQRILMLEPRRLAARAAARYMAATLGEQVGGRVGYRVRLESRVGPQTRIEVITEGVLTRLLQADPALEGVGLVIFDEFHERSIHADLGLALCLQSQAVLRNDLRILVMSATLAAESVAALLGGAPLIRSEGRSFPVKTRYLDRPVTGRMEPVVVRTIREVLEREEGDLLVFLPGAGEIRRVQESLQEELQQAAQAAQASQAAQALQAAQAARAPQASRAPQAAQALQALQAAQAAQAAQAEQAEQAEQAPQAAQVPQAPYAPHGQKGLRVRIAPLHGSLPQEAQDQAIAPARPGERKVVLATSIAETSLTVKGVRVVIDSGLMRVPRFSPRTGMTRLETLPVSMASADQRRGRAGRLGPGVCYRLWTEEAERHLLPYSTPEILEADLSPLALELAAWGVTDPTELAWLDPPPVGALAQGRELLHQLGALDEGGAITTHGRKMVKLGLHPRLAHMLLRAIPLGLGGLACELAALLGERDIFRGDRTAPEADLRLRVEALRTLAQGGAGRAGRGSAANGPATHGPAAEGYAAHGPAAHGPATHGPAPEGYAAHGYTLDLATCRRVRTEAQHLRQAFDLAAASKDESDAEACGLLLAFAYPDRIARRREEGRFLLRNGRGAAFTQPDSLAAAPYLVAAELDDLGAESRIFLAAPLTLADLEQNFSEQIAREELIAWDRTAGAVRARWRERLGALVLREGHLVEPSPEATQAALLSGIRTEGLEILPWNRNARQLQQRLLFMHLQEAGWPAASDADLLNTLEYWLGPHLYGLRSRDDLQRLHLSDLLLAMLSWQQRQELEAAAPTHVAVPSGSRIPIDYGDSAAPVLAVRLQELFGLADTPRIAHGRVPLTLHLLSPSHRPVQVTRDLASFWREAYFEVRKELRGRYPKHYWPEDPLTAQPTNRTRPRL